VTGRLRVVNGPGPRRPGRSASGASRRPAPGRRCEAGV